MIRQLSKAGTRHNKEGSANQDVVLSGDTRRFSVITLADGVSTCKEAQEGAQIACEAVTDLLLRKGTYFLEFEHEKTADFVISHIRHELRKRAQETKEEEAEYSSTIASVLLDKKTQRMMFFNLGDSLILAAEGGRCRILAMPASSTDGTPVTTTEYALSLVQTDTLDAARLDSVFICSDGAWQQMFEENRLKQEVKEMILNLDYEALEHYLEAQNASDDYSFISMNVGGA